MPLRLAPATVGAFYLHKSSGSLAMWKAVLTIVGAVYGGVDHPLLKALGERRHGSIFYHARSDSRGWRCFFSVRD